MTEHPIESEVRKAIEEAEDLVSHRLEERVSELEEEGRLEEAREVLDEAIGKARSAQNGEEERVLELMLSLEVRAGLQLRSGELDLAREDYLEAASLVSGRKGLEGTVARLCSALGYLNEVQGRDEQAIEAYEKALEQMGRERDPVVLDKVRLLNNLAFLYEARDDFEQAETLFLKALKLAHNELGSSDEDTSGVANNVGALYQKAGHYEQALEMHLMALEGRREFFGENHRDTAQSYGNLAVVQAELGEAKEAAEHFEKALTIFRALGGETREDFESVAFNYGQFLKNTGELAKAAEIEAEIGAG